MYKSKINILKEMIRNNEIESCCLIGKPTKELCDSYFDFMDLIFIFDKYKIEYEENEFEDISVTVYFNIDITKNYKDICMININNPTEKQLDLIINNLFETVTECFQRRLMPAFFAKIVGTFPSKLNFSDMLFLIPEKTQADICKKIDRSPQALSDIKSGKNNLTIEVLSKLMNLYPLLPWEQFIKDITK